MSSRPTSQPESWIRELSESEAEKLLPEPVSIHHKLSPPSLSKLWFALETKSTQVSSDICSDIALIATFLSRSNLHLAYICYGTGKDHKKCSSLVLACLHSVACQDGQPLAKAIQIWPKCLFKINSDQNICVCLFLNVHLKIVACILSWIWHWSSLHWKYRAVSIHTPNTFEMQL